MPGPAIARRLRLDRATWEATQTLPVEITVLEPCLPVGESASAA